jgi:hypothetical protein
MANSLYQVRGKRTMCEPEVQLGNSRLRLGVSGSLVLQRPLGTILHGKPRRVGPKAVNRVYNPAYLEVQKGNLGSR